MASLNRVVSLGVGTGAASVKTSTGKILPLALLTEVSVDRSWTSKELEAGDGLDPEDVAVTGKSYSIKAKCNAIYADLLASLVGGTLTTGGDAYDDETQTLTASVHTFVTTHAAATPVDRGVILANGSPGKLVASAPAIGEYTFTAASGTWTFNNAELGLVHCMCSYTDATLLSVVEGGGTVGDPTYLELVTFVTYKGQKLNRRFPACMVTKVGDSAKSKDHTSYDVEFKPYKDATTGRTLITTLSK
jgi:hypothetical protein